MKPDGVDGTTLTLNEYACAIAGIVQLALD